MDLSKYRTAFLEDASEHLAEISRALLTLEKEPDNRDAIDVIFRMAHSIKGMAATLEYASIEEISHRLEDRMQELRGAGGAPDPEGLARIFRGLEGLEAMVGALRDTGECPPADPELAAELSAPLATASGDEKKKP